jgi:CRP-like cAMP-binding protein
MKCTCEACSLNKAFFKSLQSDSVMKYCASKKELVFPPKTKIIRQGDIIDSFIYLRTGLVKLERVNEGTNQNQIISFNTPYDFISIMDIFGEDRYSYSITTLTESTFCIFSLDDIKDLILKNGSFALSIIEIQANGMKKIINNLLVVIEKRLYGKVAFLLLYFAEKVFNSDQFELPVSRKEMSEHLGLSTETIIRTLSEFRSDKIIKVFGKTIEIVDRDKLRFIAENH